MRYRLVDHGFSDAEASIIVARLRERIPAVSAEAARTIEAQLPVFVRPQDPRYAQVLPMAVGWIIGKFVDLMEDPDASLDQIKEFYVDLGRNLAQDGIREQDLQASFRIGAGVAIQRLTETAESHPGLTASVIGQVAQQVLGYIDQMTDAMMNGYLSTQAREASARGDRHRKLVDLLINEAPRLEEIRELALDAGWRVTRTVCAVALRRRVTDIDHRPSVPAEALAGLHLPEPCLIISDLEGPGRREALRHELRDWVAVIGPTVEITEVRRSLDWARRGLELVALGYVDAADPVEAVDHLPLIMALRDRTMAEYLVARHLSPLAEVRGTSRFRLAETLLCLLECDFNATEAGKRLYLHAQTVRYRVRQIERMFGPDMHDPALRLDLHLALRYWLATTREEEGPEHP